jgi:hypothetical protein
MRKDIHRPSEIIPSDYDYVAVWTMNIQGFSEAEFIIKERAICKAHMEHTGGTLRHYSNGSCGICGNVQAIYLVLFHHAKSNEYIVVGVNCAQKLEMGFDFKAMEMFKRRCADAREQQAGKRKAIALLSDAGLIDAWEVYDEKYPNHTDDCKAAGRNQFGDDNGVENACTCDIEGRVKAYGKWEERTIRDIVGKLVKFGNISEKQNAFVRSLIEKIAQRPIVEAQRQAEKDAAGPVPVGRVTMSGVVVGMQRVAVQSFSYGDDGVRTKLVIKLDNGSKVYGNRFANLEKGDKVEFTATVEATKDDPKFGFYSRAKQMPTAEEIAQAEADKAAKKEAVKANRETAKFMKIIAWG